MLFQDIPHSVLLFYLILKIKVLNEETTKINLICPTDFTCKEPFL